MFDRPRWRPCSAVAGRWPFVPWCPRNGGGLDSFESPCEAAAAALQLATVVSAFVHAVEHAVVTAQHLAEGRTHDRTASTCRRSAGAAARRLQARRSQSATELARFQAVLQAEAGSVRQAACGDSTLSAQSTAMVQAAWTSCAIARQGQASVMQPGGHQHHTMLGIRGTLPPTCGSAA